MTKLRAWGLIASLMLASVIGGGASHLLFTRSYRAHSPEPGKAYYVSLAGPEGVTCRITCTESEFSLAVDGAPRITCSVASGNPVLMFLDRNNKVRTRLALDPSGSPYLQLLDRQASDRIKIGYQRGQPFLKMKNSEGDDSILLRLDERGKPQLLMYEDEGQVGAGWVSDGKPGMSVSNEKREVLWHVPRTP